MDNSSQSPAMSASHSHEAAEADPKHKNELLDEGLDESFPASDPTAISITRIIPEPSPVKPEDATGR